MFVFMMVLYENHVVLVYQGCSTSPLAVTWLTVYRQLHIPAQGGLAATLAHKKLGTADL